MMGTKMLKHLRDAISHLNPDEVREEANRPVSVHLSALDDAAYARMENFLVPPGISPQKKSELMRILHRSGAEPDLTAIRIYGEDVIRPEGAFSFNPNDPDRLVEEILGARPELGIPLARHFYPFRQQVAENIITSVSKENALFSVATAVPSIVPFVALPWAVGEFASDTAFLTMNQIRMAFLLSAASDRTVGYKEQKTEIASLFASAFGWRALARELVGKIPFGGGLIPKAAVAYAGTYVVGCSLERLYRLGYGYTEQERRSAYEAAFERGKQVAGTLIDAYRSRQHTAAT
ncbi:MAG: hypothetical protein ACRD7E_19550 [Bryobacteraceae bacterium]